VRENIHKAVPNQNYWMIELSKDPSTNGVVETQVYDAEAIMADIKNALVSRGSMAIRGLGRVFRIIDDNRNRQIDVTELMYGLKDFGVHLNQD
jgi:Ca2+-binding EF-hand superfamily protein